MNYDEHDLASVALCGWEVVDPTPIRRGSNTFRLYRCGCGKTAEVNSHSVKSGHSKSCRSCGGKRRRKSQNYLAWAYLRHSYKSGAAARGLAWDLTDEQFLALTSACCFYCGITPEQVVKRKHAVYIYNGIDRKDNQIGYTAENCVPCCGICNMAKRDLGYSTWTDWLERIAQHTAAKGIEVAEEAA